MPIGKKIYEILSKKFKKNREAAKKRANDKPVTVNNFFVNKPVVAKPNNIRRTPVKKLNIPDNIPTINAKSHKGKVTKAVKKKDVVIKPPIVEGIAKKSKLRKKAKS